MSYAISLYINLSNMEYYSIILGVLLLHTNELLMTDAMILTDMVQ